MRGKNLCPAFLIALVISFSTPVLSAEGVQKIRIAFPSPAFSYLPFYAAQEKDILQKAGFEAEYIQMRTRIQPQAVIIGIQEELGIPVQYIGVGEEIEDLQPFTPELFVQSLFDSRT